MAETIKNHENARRAAANLESFARQRLENAVDEPAKAVDGWERSSPRPTPKNPKGIGLKPTLRAVGPLGLTLSDAMLLYLSQREESPFNPRVAERIGAPPSASVSAVAAWLFRRGLIDRRDGWAPSATGGYQRCRVYRLNQSGKRRLIETLQRLSAAKDGEG